MSSCRGSGSGLGFSLLSLSLCLCVRVLICMLCTYLGMWEGGTYVYVWSW